MASVQVTFTVETIMTNVRKQLAIIGKRAYGADGKNKFSEVTYSTLEASAVEQYMFDAIYHLFALCGQFSPQHGYAREGVWEITFEHTRWGSIATPFGNMARSFIVSYVLAQYLGMINPEAAQKFEKDAEQKEASIITLLYNKEYPTKADTYTDPTGAVTT